MTSPFEVVEAVTGGGAQAVAAVWGARWSIAAALAAAVAVWGVVAVAWRRRAVGELERRAEVQYLPSLGFDTDMDEVMQQGARLGRIAAAAGTVPRRARATRIRLTSSAEGLLEYRVCGPERAAGLLRQHQFAGVDVLDAAAALSRSAAPRVEFETAPPEPTGGVR